MNARDLFLEHLSAIEEMVFLLCRRSGMRSEDIEEFSAELKLRFIQDDYAVIRAFEGRSSFQTYLGAVVSRALLDYRIREWGKWYASAIATRLGPLAVDLERMLYRDQRTLDEALAALRPKYADVTRAELERLMGALPARVRRKRVDFDTNVHDLITPAVFVADQESVSARISEIIRESVDVLPESDRRILRLRFDADLSVAEIARALELDQQAVYRQLYRLFRVLRKKLEAKGVHAADIEDIIGSDVARLDFHLQTEDGAGELIDLEDVRKAHDR